MLNVVSCETAFENVGYGKCTFTPREITGMFIVPDDFLIKESDTSDLQTFLYNKITDPVKSKRVFPILGFVGVEDGSEEPVRETLGYGSTRTLKEGNYAWTFRFEKGGLCLLRSLQKINGQSVNVIFIDGAGVMFGAKKTVGGDTGLGGIPIDDFWANKWTISDGAGASTSLSVYLSFKPVHVNENLSFLSTSELSNFDIYSVRGVQDIVIDVVSATSSAIKYKLRDKCSGSVSSFSEVYETELKILTSAVVTDEDGIPETIDDIAYNDVTNEWTITLDPVRTSDSILSLADIATLTSNGIEGFESNRVSVPL